MENRTSQFERAPDPRRSGVHALDLNFENRSFLVSDDRVKILGIIHREEQETQTGIVECAKTVLWEPDRVR